MIWDPAKECMDKKERESLQLHRLLEVVDRVSKKVPYYKRAFEQIGVKAEDIRTLADIRRLPFTTKYDLQAQYPLGLLAVAPENLIRFHSTPGITGKSTVVGYTRKDIDMWSEMVARIITMGGVTPADRAQVSIYYGLLSGGLGYHYGLEKIGSAVVPASGGNTRNQATLLQDFGVTVLLSTPSYALHLAEVAQEMGVLPQGLQLKVGFFTGEPWSETMRQEIEKRWRIKAYDNYGVTTIIGPGVAGECEEREGLHINEDHFLAEVVDPATGEPVPYGQLGELVITTLTKEGMPVIRYRTRDMTRLCPEPCPCGRTTMRMERVKGRVDEVLSVKGIRVFPSQIESILVGVEWVAPHYRIIVDRKGYLDTLEVQVEVQEDKFAGNFRGWKRMERQLEERLRNALAIGAKVRLLDPKALERSTGKAQRVVDRRGRD